MILFSFLSLFSWSFLVDTKIIPEEWNNDNFSFLEKFEPFGECNEEPLFLFENLEVQKIEKVGKN